MANTPNFVGTPRIGIGVIDATHGVNPNRDTTGASGPIDVITGSINGTRINEIVLQSAPAAHTDASVITIFVYNPGPGEGNGVTGYYVYDEIVCSSEVASSTTVANYRDRRIYDNLLLPNETWKLAASTTVAVSGPSGKMNVIALAGDL